MRWGGWGRAWLGVAVMLAGLAMAAGAMAAAHTVLAAVPISRMDLRWWRVRHEVKLKEVRSRQPALIFLGDSITADWELHGPPDWREFAPVWQRYYGDRNAVNLGFKGDTTASLLWRIDNGEVAGIAPRVAVVLIGANNMGRPHWSAQDTVAGIEAIVHDLHHRLPETKLLLLSVLPSDRSPWITATTAEINRMLAARFGRPDSGVTYLDVTHVFLRDGHLDRTLFLDPKLTPPEAPLHPDAQGAALLAAAMEPTLATLLGDRPHH